MLPIENDRSGTESDAPQGRGLPTGAGPTGPVSIVPGNTDTN